MCSLNVQISQPIGFGSLLKIKSALHILILSIETDIHRRGTKIFELMWQKIFRTFEKHMPFWSDDENGNYPTNNQ